MLNWLYVVFISIAVFPIGNAIIENDIPQVIFSSFAIGYKDLIKYLKKKNKSIKIKTY